MFEQLAAFALFRRLRVARDVDPRVVDAMELVPRHAFVDETVGARVYADTPFPIGHGQTISQPRMLAHMLTAAAVQPGERVLEVGAGSGYAAAVLSVLAREVVAVERISALADKARERLASYENVRVLSGDAIDDALDDELGGPFDVVFVSAGAVDVPEELVRRTRSGGRIIIPVGERTPRGSVDGELCRVTVVDGEIVRHEQIMRCSFVPLVSRTR